MPVKVWLSPLIGGAALISGLMENNALLAVFGLVVGAYGVYRIAQYNSL